MPGKNRNIRGILFSISLPRKGQDNPITHSFGFAIMRSSTINSDTGMQLGGYHIADETLLDN